MLSTILIVGAAWLAFVAVLWLHRPSRATATLLLGLIPDVARLAVRLGRDASTPRRYRLGLLALAGYLAMPIDLVPDFIPVIGALDDVIVVALVLRWVGRGVGRETVERHWTGSDEGLDLLRRALGTPSDHTSA